MWITFAEQINSNSVCIFITCKLTLGSGIVAFIGAAAGRLVCEDLQWGNRTQELFPGHEGRQVNGSPAGMTSSLSPHLWLIGLRFHVGAGTIHYWVWSSVTKRPGHLTALLYWSMRCSHHWQTRTDHFGAARRLNYAVLLCFVWKMIMIHLSGRHLAALLGWLGL